MPPTFFKKTSAQGISRTFAVHFSPTYMPEPVPHRHAADYGPLAPVYDLLAAVAFGGSLRRAQRAALAAGLPGLGPQPRILVLGGGTGWVLSPLWQHCPTAQVLYMEVAASMLAATQARLARHPPPAGARLELRHGSEADLQPGEQFDAIITFFVLDSFLPHALPAALGRLQATLAPQARWLVVDFWPAQAGWRRALLRAMYLFFRVTVRLQARTMPPWPDSLAALGLRPTWEQRFFGKAVAAQVWQ